MQELFNDLTREVLEEVIDEQEKLNDDRLYPVDRATVWELWDEATAEERASLPYESKLAGYLHCILGIWHPLMIPSTLKYYETNPPCPCCQIPLKDSDGNPVAVFGCNVHTYYLLKESPITPKENHVTIN